MEFDASRYPLVAARTVCRSGSGDSTLIKGRLHAEYSDGLYPAFSASGQDVYTQTFAHEGTAIILSAVGARCGKCFLTTGKWSAIANTHIVWPDEGQVDPRYLHLILNDEAFWVRGGSAQPFVKVRESLEKLIPVPATLDEQRRVVGRIKECLSRVEEMQRLWGEAQTEIGSLENAWLRERFAELAAQWPSQQLACITRIRGGGSLPKGTATPDRDDDLLLVKVGDMNLPGNEIEIGSAREYCPARNSHEAWPAGTVVFPKRGGAIATNKKRLLGRPAILDPNLMGVIADLKKVRPRFLLAQFKILDLSTLTSGSTVPQLNRKDLAPLPFVVPDLRTQDAVITQADQVSTKVHQMAAGNSCSSELAALRESILREAFAGNL